MTDDDNWYLLGDNTRPNSLGGFENQAFRDYKYDAFNEALETDIAIDVIIYRSDLTEICKTRCIIEGNTPNTMLKSLQRNVMTKIGTLKTGYYIYFDDSYWLVDGRVSTNGIFEKASVKICQYCLRWQNNIGNIIERWAFLETASKYDIGLEQKYMITLNSNNFTVWLPNDEETVHIDGKRVFIDGRINEPIKVYKLTRNDDVLFLYNKKGGVLSLIADRSEINPETDNQELKICDYIPVETIAKNIKEEYIPFYKLKMLFNGSKFIKPNDSKIITANLIDVNGDKIENCEYKWEVESDFIDFVKYTINNDKITINLSDTFDDIGELVVRVSSNGVTYQEIFNLIMEV